MTGDLRWLVHHAVVHPICGVLWFVGLTSAADWLHDTAPVQE